MSLSITERQELFRYLDNSIDLNPDAKIYSLICEFCRDNNINILLSEIDQLGIEYLIEYINKKEKKNGN